MNVLPDDNTARPLIAAVVLAAGESTRMGQPKMVLPWGGTTMIGAVVNTLEKSDVMESIVVTGGSRALVEAEIRNLIVNHPLRIIHNPHYQDGEMLLSVQVGLNAVSERAEAALIVLGDQPQVDREIVEQIIREYSITRCRLIVPRYLNRRGHPWLVARIKWQDILSLGRPRTLRDFLNMNADHIHYLEIATESILSDVDTPEDYRRFLENPGELR